MGCSLSVFFRELLEAPEDRSSSGVQQEAGGIDSRGRVDPTAMDIDANEQDTQQSSARPDSAHKARWVGRSKTADPGESATLASPDSAAIHGGIPLYSNYQLVLVH